MDIFLCLENWEVVKDTKVRLSFPHPAFYAICTKWMNGISVTNFDHFVTAWELQNFVANLILREINLKNWTTFLLQNWAVKHCKYVFFVKLVDKFAILSVKLITTMRIFCNLVKSICEFFREIKKSNCNFLRQIKLQTQQRSELN